MQGKSLIPIAKGKEPKKMRIYLLFRIWSLHIIGVRIGRYKLIYYYTVNEWELFDLEKDPDEMENLFEWGGYKVHPEYESVAQELTQKLKQLRKEYKDTTGKPVRVWSPKQYD